MILILVLTLIKAESWSAWGSWCYISSDSDKRALSYLQVLNSKNWNLERAKNLPVATLTLYVVAVVAVVAMWRGLWQLMDICLWPESPKRSSWASFIIGFMPIFMVLALINPQQVAFFRDWEDCLVQLPSLAVCVWQKIRGVERNSFSFITGKYELKISKT